MEMDMFEGYWGESSYSNEKSILEKKLKLEEEKAQQIIKIDNQKKVVEELSLYTLENVLLIN